METDVDAAHLDLDELARLLQHIRQGDVLDVAKIATLFSPDSPSSLDDAKRVAHEEPVMTVERRVPAGLSAIITQTCDVRRPPSVEPYLVLAPLASVTAETYREAEEHQSVRYFATGAIEGHEDKGPLVIDARVMCSIEKAALLSTHIQLMPGPLSDVTRDRLRSWLADRLGRPALPDEIVQGVVHPVEQAFKRLRQKPDTAPLCRSVVWMGLDWQPGKRSASVLVLLDPALREANIVQPQDVSVVLTRLRKALDHFAGRAGGGYTILAEIHDITERPATDILVREELVLDLDGIDL